MVQEGTRSSDDEHRMSVLTSPGGPFPLVEREQDGVVLEVFDREPRTLRDAFFATHRYADRTALVYLDERYTYADQDEIVRALATALREELRVQPGDRLAVAMRNYPEFVFWFWASQLVGAVVTPLNAWLTGPELTPLVAVAAPVVVVADRQRLDALSAVDLAAYGVRAVVGVRAPAPSGWAGVEYLDSAELVAAHRGAAGPEEVELAPGDPATILFTSGTTGPPKAVVGTHLNHTASLLNKLIRSVPLAADGRSAAPVPRSVRLLTFPFFHIAGISNLYTAAYSGHQLVLMYKWDAEEAARLVEAERVRELAGPPFVVQTFLDVAATTERDLSTLRGLGMGGSAAPDHLITAIGRVFGGRVAPRGGYGLTETTAGVVAISGPEFVAHPDSVGRPLPTVQLRILGEDGAPVPPGTAGEIALRGPQIARSLRPTADDPPSNDGWFRTGDLGRVDQDGLLYVVGRSKDVVIRGGENINCAEVESCLDAHPDVLEVAVFGLPHPSLGEEPAALVRVRPGSPTGPDELRAHVAARLAAFKVPARVVLVERPLPRTASGKLVKRGLLEQLPAGPEGTR